MLYAAADAGGKAVLRAHAADRRVLWETPMDASGDLILAGHSLYSAGAAGIQRLTLPDDPQKVVPTAPPAAEVLIPPTTVTGTIQRLLAADQKRSATKLAEKASLSIREIKKPSMLVEGLCPRLDSNQHVTRTVDFESTVSTISPPAPQ